MKASRGCFERSSANTMILYTTPDTQFQSQALATKLPMRRCKEAQYIYDSYFLMKWLQSNSMCIDRRQSTQLCLYHMRVWDHVKFLLSIGVDNKIQAKSLQFNWNECLWNQGKSKDNKLKLQKKCQGPKWRHINPAWTLCDVWRYWDSLPTRVCIKQT